MTKRSRDVDAEIVGVGCAGCLALVVGTIKVAAWIAIIAIAAHVLGGCGAAPVCASLATRCAETRLEVCDASGQWYTALDCAEVERTSGGAWACGETREDGEEINACLPR